MAENSKIEWCDHTFNPWIGCAKVSDACDNCYAETWDNRFKGQRWGARAPRTRTSQANWRKPLAWNRDAEKKGIRYRVFCASLADVFDNHRSITSGWHGDLWHLIDQTPHLDWLLLTKRPQNIKKMLPESYGMPEWGQGWPNVWLGTTVENQTEANRRIPHLLDVPAAVRFLSCEPLLGAINLTHFDIDGQNECFPLAEPEGRAEGYATLDWVIAGGESGPNARPSHPIWFRNIRNQCTEAGVPFLFKQWGEWAPWHHTKLIPGYKISAEGIDKRIHISLEGRTGGNPHIPGDYTMYRFGKKAAGRMLDGIEHNAMPSNMRPTHKGDSHE